MCRAEEKNNIQKLKCKCLNKQKKYFADAEMIVVLAQFTPPQRGYCTIRARREEVVFLFIM